MPDALMLFAAGFGTRMGSLTKTRPKPLIPVAGKPLIDHAIELARDAGISRIVANAHYLHEQVSDHLAGTDISISLEAPEILDTGGGLKAARNMLGTDTVFTLNTDAIWRGPNPLRLLRDAWDPDRMDCLLLGVSPENARGHSGTGDFSRSPSGHISRSPGFTYTGAQILRTDLLDRIEEASFSLNRVWDRLIGSDRMTLIPYPGLWCDVGHPEGIAIAERMLEEQDV